MRVAVYYNLHTHLWSIRALRGLNTGRVIAHAKRLVLSDVSFRVSENGRQKVIREKVKNVHAFVVGHLESVEGVVWRYSEVFVSNDKWPAVEESDRCEITYNPYRDTGFIDRDSRELVAGFPWVVMDEKRLVYAKRP